MAPQNILLDSKIALKHGFRRTTDLSFARDQMVAPMQIAETGTQIATLPFAFAKIQEGKYFFVAILGFADGKNLLIDTAGRWLGTQVPFNYQAYPFSLQVAEGDTPMARKLALCFDHASGQYRETPNIDAGEVRFFDDEGKPQEVLKQVANFLSANVARQQVTQTAVDALAAANLLKPWQLVANETQQSKLPQGLYSIDEQALTQLDAETVMSLHKNHALLLAHAQLLSMSRTSFLQMLEQRQKAKDQTETAAQQSIKVAQAMGDPLGETLRFDWLK